MGRTNQSAVVKTGLGSSACLVTSIIGALVYGMEQVTLQQQEPSPPQPSSNPPADVNRTEHDIDDTEQQQQRQRHIIHNLAQICHCHAQGKIGSGFDVSAACYGSQVYQRFAHDHLPKLLSALEEEEEEMNRCNGDAEDKNQDENGNDSRHPDNRFQTMLTVLRDTVQASWQGGVQQPVTALSETLSSSSSSPSSSSGGQPSLLQVSLADVSGGSESPSMARAVLQWKITHTTTGETSHWDALAEINVRIATLFQQVAEEQTNVTEVERTLLATTTATEWKTLVETENYPTIVQLLLDLRQAFLDARRHLKAMGEAAGVPIEPEEQTQLADATMAHVPGVVAALVPGAGGNDALACVHINNDQVRHNLAALWTNWSESAVQVCPLDVQGVNYGDGVRIDGPVTISRCQ